MNSQILNVLLQYGGEHYKNYRADSQGNGIDAVVFDSDRDFRNALADAINNAINSERFLLANFIRSYKKDQLGLSIIIY